MVRGVDNMRMHVHYFLPSPTWYFSSWFLSLKSARCVICLLQGRLSISFRNWAVSLSFGSLTTKTELGTRHGLGISKLWGGWCSPVHICSKVELESSMNLFARNRKQECCLVLDWTKHMVQLKPDDKPNRQDSGYECVPQSVMFCIESCV